MAVYPDDWKRTTGRSIPSHFAYMPGPADASLLDLSDGWSDQVRSNLDIMTQLILKLSAYAPINALVEIPIDADVFRNCTGSTAVIDNENFRLFRFPHDVWEYTQVALAQARIECMRNISFYPTQGPLFFSVKTGDPLTSADVFMHVAKALQNADRVDQNVNET